MFKLIFCRGMPMNIVDQLEVETKQQMIPSDSLPLVHQGALRDANKSKRKFW